ncbi:MBL fold metallo-hydrolase [Sulfuricurvum sp.]|uniref:MBL fold metallo-hydrolase n=1 Tax=Sulfuricurvum sp. TaxID=2025608 RepID=UPI002605D4ED|nr:MBL fold metallo-hydrolase [Sulfuricurvum sp.]MDD3597191.1 MBL fold metallo-hydrolase [Sulfuricurvum sp.]
MQIQFVGATERVTGSCTWMKYQQTGIEFLIDCGMVQGELHERYENNKEFPFKPRNIKFVLLTHAHLDHCGLIPRLYNEGFVGKVICTNATARLAKEILIDSAKQSKGLYSERDVYKIEFEPLDFRRDFKWAKPIPLDKDLFVYFQRSAHILGSASIGLIWNKNDQEQNDILFTGDIGNNTETNPFQPLLKYRQKPYQTLKNIVIESTYGNREHSHENLSFDKRIELLESHVNHTLAENEGQLIIPAFSLHRTQEILFDLYYLFQIKWKNNPIKVWQSPRPELDDKEYDEYIASIESIDPEILNNLYIMNDSKKYKLNPNYKDIKIKAIFPVQVIWDSPLARKISNIYAEELCRSEYNEKDGIRKYPYRNHKMNEWLSIGDDELNDLMQELYTNNKLQIGMHSIKYQDSKVTKSRPCVIITSSGMCDKGPVLEHLKRVLKDSKNTVLLTGYQSSGSNGSFLLSLSNMNVDEKESRFIQIEEMKITACEINARIEKIGGYSGHTDQNGLLDYLFTNDEKRKYTVPNIFINHGSNDARNSLKNAIHSYSNSIFQYYFEEEIDENDVVTPTLDNQFFDLDL